MNKRDYIKAVMLGDIINVRCESCDVIVGVQVVSNAHGMRGTHQRKIYRLRRGVYQFGKSTKYFGLNASFCSEKCLNKVHPNIKIKVNP